MAFKYSDYLVTPSDIYRGILHIKNNMRRRDLVGMIILAFLFYYTNHLGWQIDSSIFFCFFAAIFFWNLDSRISIALALIFLTSCPFLLISYNDYNFLWGEDWAETAAVWAYYLLVFGVVKQMWDFRKERGDTDTNANTTPHPDPLPEEREKMDANMDAEANTDTSTNTTPHPSPLPQGARGKIDTNADTDADTNPYSNPFPKERENIDTNVDTQSEIAKRECWIPASAEMTNVGTGKKDEIKTKTVDLASFIKYMEKKKLSLDIRAVRKKRKTDSRRGLFSKGKGGNDAITQYDKNGFPPPRE